MAGRGFYVNFKVPEIQKTLSQISAYDGKARIRVEEAVQKSTKAIRAGMIKRIHNVSGYLKKHTSSSFNKKDVVGLIRAKAPHAHLVEFGHKGALIKPKNNEALGTPYGPREEVRTKGVPEHPFARPAYEDEKPTLIRNLSEAVKP